MAFDGLWPISIGHLALFAGGVLNGVVDDASGGFIGGFKIADCIVQFSVCLNGDIARATAAHQTGYAAGFDGIWGQSFDPFGQFFTIGLDHVGLIPAVAFAGVAHRNPSRHLLNPLSFWLFKRISAGFTSTLEIVNFGYLFVNTFLAFVTLGIYVSVTIVMMFLTRGFYEGSNC